MAKCSRCGKGGLFHKVHSTGLCSQCTTIVEAEHRISRLNDEFQRKQNELQEQTQRLVEELEHQQKMRDDVHRQFCGEAEQQLKDITDATFQRRQELQNLTNSIETAEKKLQTTKNRITRLQRMFDSMHYAMDQFMLPDTQRDQVAPLFDIEDLGSIVPENINCLNVKELRSQYRQNERCIKEVCESYQERYTTKTNATIYKLMVLALEAELQNILHSIAFGKLESAQQSVKTLTAKYYAIATEGNQSIAPTITRFIGQIEGLYLNAIRLEYEYYVQRERAKEEQRALKEQMRQEAEEQKRLEIERKKVDAEAQKYQLEINRITEQLQKAHDTELGMLKAQLSKVQAMLNSVEDKKAEIINLQNGKAGTVYIISNIGSFGENVFKIGMTRRLEPQDRVNELGDASVPFPFDVHSFIFSEDAVSLETALHKELNDRRINKINMRKEFFKISVDELQSMVERIDPTAPFKVTALAEQFHQSESMDSIPDMENLVSFDDELIES